jgi:hypothetical protein
VVGGQIIVGVNLLLWRRVIVPTPLDWLKLVVTSSDPSVAGTPLVSPFQFSAQSFSELTRGTWPLLVS